MSVSEAEVKVAAEHGGTSGGVVGDPISAETPLSGTDRSLAQHPESGEAPQNTPQSSKSDSGDNVAFSKTGSSDGEVAMPVWASSVSSQTRTQSTHRQVSIRMPERDEKEVMRRQASKRLAKQASQHSLREAVIGNVDLSWHNIRVELPPNEKKKRAGKVILNNVSGRARRGQVLAIMGASGAGKTTFLNLLSGRTASVLAVTGILAINGQSVTTKQIQRISAYVQQQDVFFPNLTVREHLIIQALLRMNNALTTAHRVARVEEVLAELGLDKVENNKIGSTTGGVRGISGGESKRLAFAAEVLTDPPLLFADEPTSGLDTFAAQVVVQQLVSMAEAGRTILCTIHQPPSEVFTKFHQLLLFAEGRTAYIGQRDAAVPYFAQLGYECPSSFNPADYFIYTLAVKPTAVDQSKARIKEVTDAFAEKEERDGPMEIPDPAKSTMNRVLKDMSHQHGEGRLTQLRVVAWRTWLNTSREPQVVKVQFGTSVVVGLMVGLIFLQITDKKASERVQNVNGLLFFVMAQLTFNAAFPVVQSFPLEMPIFLRDHDNKMYKTWIYFLCKSFASVPFQILFTFIYAVILYMLAGLDYSAERFFIFAAVAILISFCAESVGYFISAIAFDNVAVAVALTPPTIIPFMLFGGLLLNSDTTPDYFIWLDRMSWIKWGFEASMVNEWKDVTYLQDCNTDMMALNMTTAATGRTTGACFENGHSVLRTFRLSTSSNTIGENISIIIGLTMAFRLVAYIILLLKLRYSIKR